ncbi:MAG: hypothetical protein ACOCZ5_00760 [bacterium]
MGLKLVRENINTNKSLMNLLKEEKEEYDGVIRTQKDFNWKKHYPDYLKYNTPLEIEGNNVILYHYGDDNDTGYLNPHEARKQTKSYTRDFEQWSVPRIFFYINPQHKEWRLRYKQKYVVKYPLNKLYPFNHDPFRYLEESEDEEGFRMDSADLQLQHIGPKAMERGFDGLILKWSNEKYRVDIWKKVPV